MPKPISRVVSIWLLIGCVMVLCQILIGGITRLTDSGLSITEWNVVKGTLPPLNETEWILSFEKYKTFAKKQYESLHKDMSLEEFKRIYFWEYFHRLWARMMGLVFIIPFIYFLFKRKIEWPIIKRLIIVVLLASLSAIFGWLMVASGLNDDKRTWVNAYNLLIHLILASSLFAYLIYTYYKYSFKEYDSKVEFSDYYLLKTLGVVIFIQIGFGALMAGMKAALIFPYPLMILKLDLVKQMLANSSISHLHDLYDYEPNSSVKVWVQIIHRVTAYSILLLSSWFFWINRIKFFYNKSFLVFFIILLAQIILGILTVSLSIGKIPVFFGVTHQVFAFLLLCSYLWILFISRARK